MQQSSYHGRRPSGALLGIALLLNLANPALGKSTINLEADRSGTAITLDDDLFSAPGRDRDYTGGVAITLSGARAARYFLSADPLLEKLDRIARLPVDTAKTSHALALGALAFTPQDIASSKPILDDRPYASLVFLSNTRRYLSSEQDVVYSSHLTVGALGLDLVGSSHRAIHRLASSDPIRGYAHQISAGGEPTVRYSVARQAALGRPSPKADLKWTVAASVGTVTESSLAVNARWGRIRSPWWSFTPEQNLYLQDTQPLSSLPAFEAFFTTGVRLKARVYNAFLQGQFRHSEVRQPSENLNILLGEAWTGVVVRQPSGLELRYLARWGSPELRHGVGARELLWGSVEFAKHFH